MVLDKSTARSSTWVINKRRISFGAKVLAVIATVVCGSHEASAAWPERVIRLIVPFSAGSSSDAIARVVATKMSQVLGQPMIVDNRPGGSSIIGAQAIAKAAPDGYTLGVVNTTSQVATVVFNADLPFDPGADFSPIAEIGVSPFVLMAPVRTSIQTLPDYVAAARANPGKLTYASAGVSTLSHLAGQLIVSKFGADVMHIPYPGSSNEMVDIIAGRIDMAVGTIAPTLSAYRAGQIQYFAIMNKERSRLIPDIPTVDEVGAVGCEAGLWTALVGPAGIPPAIVARLNQVVRDLVTDPDVQRVLTSEGVQAKAGPPEALSELIRSDLSKWKKVAAGIPGGK